MSNTKTALPGPQAMTVASGPVPQEPITPKRVLLASSIPGGKCDFVFAHSLCDSVKALLVNEVVVVQALYDCVNGKRMDINQAITDAWKNDFDGLAIVSSDAVWSPEALYALVTSDKDCVSMASSHPDYLVAPIGEIPRMQIDSNTGEIKSLGVNVDFMFLSRFALSELCKTSVFVNYFGSQVKLALTAGENFTEFADENTILKTKLWELNLETWINPSYTVTVRSMAAVSRDLGAQIAAAS